MRRWTPALVGVPAAVLLAGASAFLTLLAASLALHGAQSEPELKARVERRADLALASIPLVAGASIAAFVTAGAWPARARVLLPLGVALAVGTLALPHAVLRLA